MIIKTLKAFKLRDTSTGKLTSLAHGIVATMDSTIGNQLISDGLAQEHTPLVPKGTMTIVANGTYDVAQYANAEVSVEASLDVVVSAVAEGVDLFGKDAGDLQEDIAISNGAIAGTLKHVTDYTGFSSKVEEQSGNYIGLKVEAEADSITVELVGGTLGHPVTLDEDGMIVLKIADTSTQSITVVATKGTVSETLSFSIAGLTLAE